MKYQNSRAREIIEEWVHRDIDKRIMELRLTHKMTLEEIAEVVGMSSKQVGRIVKKLSEEIFSHY